jgi:hypothetical protein
MAHPIHVYLAHQTVLPVPLLHNVPNAHQITSSKDLHVNQVVMMVIITITITVLVRLVILPVQNAQVPHPLNVFNVLRLTYLMELHALQDVKLDIIYLKDLVTYAPLVLLHALTNRLIQAVPMDISLMALLVHNLAHRVLMPIQQLMSAQLVILHAQFVPQIAYAVLVPLDLLFPNPHVLILTPAQQEPLLVKVFALIAHLAVLHAILLHNV